MAKSKKRPSPAQMAARRRFIKMVKAKARARRKGKSRPAARKRRRISRRRRTVVAVRRVAQTRSFPMARRKRRSSRRKGSSRGFGRSKSSFGALDKYLGSNVIPIGAGVALGLSTGMVAKTAIKQVVFQNQPSFLDSGFGSFAFDIGHAAAGYAIGKRFKLGTIAKGYAVGALLPAPIQAIGTAVAKGTNSLFRTSVPESGPLALGFSDGRQNVRVIGPASQPQVAAAPRQSTAQQIGSAIGGVLQTILGGGNNTALSGFDPVDDSYDQTDFGDISDGSVPPGYGLEGFGTNNNLIATSVPAGYGLEGFDNDDYDDGN